MTARVALVSLLLLLTGAPTGAQDDAPETAPQTESALPIANLTPLEMAAQIPSRLRTDLFREELPVRVGAPGERRAAAATVIEELHAPFATEACRAVFPGAAMSATDAAPHYPESDPAATTRGEAALLVPEVLPPLSRDDADVLQAKGVLPFELMLAGEWARAVASRHAGPAPADPLLRQARAAKLEGVARLAGIALSIQAAGIGVADLGARIVDADADESGWPRAALQASARTRLNATLHRVLTEDGLRWAAYHFLVGGVDALIAALERPALGPGDLLTPGRKRAAARLAGEGCRIGPRPAALFLVGSDDASWIDDLADDLWSVREGRIVVALAFDSEDAATRVAADLAASGWQARASGLRVDASRARP